MHKEGPRAFWLSFWVTLAVLIPLIAAVGILGAMQGQGAQPARKEQSGIPERRDGARYTGSWLVALAGPQPEFMLLRMDAPGGQILLAALPGSTRLQGGTLAQCYADAGPARAKIRLEQELHLPVQHYLAITPENLVRAMGELAPARVNLTRLLPQEQLEALGGPVQEFCAATAAEFLARQPQGSKGQSALRCAVWEAFVRQDLEQLPQVVPDGLRRVSSTLLTDLTALDLYALEEGLQWLADASARVEPLELPGPDSPEMAHFVRRFGGSPPMAEETPRPQPSPQPSPPPAAGGL